MKFFCYSYRHLDQNCFTLECNSGNYFEHVKQSSANINVTIFLSSLTKGFISQHLKQNDETTQF